MPSFSGVFTLNAQMQAKAAELWIAVPNAPTIGTATDTDATSATVSFTAPAFNGNSPITSYTATSSPDGITGTLNQAGSGTITVTGLTTGTTYTFTVTATNAIGTSAPSAASNSVTPVLTVPDAPTIGTATVTGATSATVSFTAPAFNGNSPITSYTATSSPDGITGTLNQAGSGTITVTGLTEGISYTFTVTATNAIGTSEPSAASNSVIPVLTPGQALGGGFFAGQISTTANSVATHNLIIGPFSTAQFIGQWKTSNSATTGTNSDIDGPANTTAMIAAGAAAHPCGDFCNNLVTGGFSDWYMPAKNELEVCYYNLKPSTNPNNTSSGINPNAVPARASNYTSNNPAQTSAADFKAITGPESFSSAFYWSSTEFSATDARNQFFGNGIQSRTYKSYSYRVRAVRRVPV